MKTTLSALALACDSAVTCLGAARYARDHPELHRPDDVEGATMRYADALGRLIDAAEAELDRIDAGEGEAEVVTTSGPEAEGKAAGYLPEPWRTGV